MDTKVKVVNMTGRVTLATATELRESLRASIDEKPMVLVSLSGTEDIDLSGVQLLYGARRYAESLGKEFHLTGGVPEDIARKLFRTGFVTEITRDGKALERNLHDFVRTPVTDKQGDQTNA